VKPSLFVSTLQTEKQSSICITELLWKVKQTSAKNEISYVMILDVFLIWKLVMARVSYLQVLVLIANSVIAPWLDEQNENSLALFFRKRT
jgi:hypothetical protein